MRKLPEWEREPTHEPDGSSEDCHYLSWGKYLSPVDARRLERILQRNPNDLAARLKLVGFYRRSRFSSVRKETSSELWKHVFWMIEHRPADYVCGVLPTPKSPKVLDTYTKLWLTQCSNHSENWYVICNAAASLRGEPGIKLYKRALKLKPARGLPARRIAQTYRMKAIRGPKSQRRASARKAFKYAELALTLQDTRGEKTNILVEFTWVAILFGEIDLASRWTTRLLKHAHSFSIVVGFWEQYALIYRASVCLERDDISTCRRTLAALAASFKNDLSHVIENQMLFRLLDQLLIRGERDAVLNFIGSIAQIIESKRAVQQWRRWEIEIRNGKSPRIEWPKRLERSYRKQVHSRR